MPEGKPDPGTPLLAYFACAYSGPDAGRLAEAMRAWMSPVVKALDPELVYPVSPICHAAGWGDSAWSLEQWHRASAAVVPRFDCLVVVTHLLGPEDDSHDRSRGVAVEVGAAAEAGVPVARVRADGEAARLRAALDGVFGTAWRRGGTRSGTPPETFLLDVRAPA